MRGNYAAGVLVIMTAMLVTSIIAAYIITGTAVSLYGRVNVARQNLDCVLSAVGDGSDPSACLSDLNALLEVNGDGA